MKNDDRRKSRAKTLERRYARKIKKSTGRKFRFLIAEWPQTSGRFKILLYG